MTWCFEMALTRLAKVEKRVEKMMIWCLEMALTKFMKVVALYLSTENKMKKKQFTEDLYLAQCVHLALL